jgi:hypothetical protein
MRCFKDILIAGGAVLMLILLFELGLRATGAKYESSFYESDPVLYMALRPNAEGWEVKESENFIRINSLGMRDKEHNLTSPPGTIRVALLGDSMIAGEQVPLEKTMARVLEAMLRKESGSVDHSYEVLNFAVGGYTLSQELLTLQAKVWDFRPDVIVLFLSPSSVPSCDRHVYPASIPFFDVRDGRLVPDPGNHPPAASTPEARRWHAMFGDLMNRVRLLQLIRKATQDGIPQEIAKLKGAKRSRNENILNMWLRPPVSPAQENAWEVADGILGQMAQDTRNHGAEFWLSAIGPEIEDNPNEIERVKFLRAHGIDNFDYAETRLRSIAAAHSVKFIPLEGPLTEYAERNQVSIRGFFNTRPNYGHWNETGNAAAAIIVADSLLHPWTASRVDEPPIQGKVGHVHATHELAAGATSSRSTQSAAY